MAVGLLVRVVMLLHQALCLELNTSTASGTWLGDDRMGTTRTLRVYIVLLMSLIQYFFKNAMYLQRYIRSSVRAS